MPRVETARSTSHRTGGPDAGANLRSVWLWVLAGTGAAGYAGALWKAYRDHPLLGVRPGREVVELGDPHEGERLRGSAGSVRFAPGRVVHPGPDMEMMPGYWHTSWWTETDPPRVLVSLSRMDQRGWPAEVDRTLTSRLWLPALLRRALMLHPGDTARLARVRTAGLQGWRVRTSCGKEGVRVAVHEYHLFDGGNYLHLKAIGFATDVEALEPDRLAAGVEGPHDGPDRPRANRRWSVRL